MTGIPRVTHADVCTCAKCNTKANRIAAFGAIRRAAEIARSYDNTYTDDEWWLIVGDCIRDAIRAAIGSPKA